MYENIAVAGINTAVNGIELSFSNKPPYEVLKDLKENGFRWHNKKQIWYGRNTAENVRAVEKYVDINASDVSFGVTPEGTVDIRGLRNKRLGLSFTAGTDSAVEVFGTDLDVSMKDWYAKQYPDDTEAISMDWGTNVLFRDLFEGLDGEKDVHSLYPSDSVVRERLFAHLSDILKCDYSTIYYQWLEGKPGDLTAAIERISSETAKSAEGYELGFGHLGNGVTVWNKLREENGDYQTVAHISADREITFYDKNIPESVMDQIREFAANENPSISATQSVPVFGSVAKEEKRVKDEEKAPCMADYYDSVGGTRIYRDSTVEGSLWSSVGSKGYYADINAYIWCNYNSAVVIELDNAMKRGKECKRYSIYSRNQDSHCYLVNECKINSPRALYDFVRSGNKLPGDGELTVVSEKGVDVFSPFVSVSPLKELPEKWKKGDLVKAIMSGQVFSGVLDQRLTDDYAYDAAVNFGSGRRVNLPGQAADLVESCRDCYIRSEGVDENGVVSVHFSYAGDMKTFLFDVNCNLRESIVRQEQAQRELEAHNEQIRASVKKFGESDIDISKVYVVEKVVEDSNTGKLNIASEVIQGFKLVEHLEYEDITDIKEAEFVANKLYEVAGFFNRRDYAESDSRIIDTGNWGQICSGKAVEELTREGVSLNLSIGDYKRPITFEEAKKDCINFISGKMSFMFGEQVDYSESLRKLEAEEVRLAQNKSVKKELSSLSDIIGFAEIKKEFEKNQRDTAAYEKESNLAFDR